MPWNDSTTSDLPLLHGSETHPEVSEADSHPTDTIPPDTIYTNTKSARFNHYYRCAIFFVIETAYIALASYLLHNTLQLPYLSKRYSVTTIRSAIGTAFLVWHTLAVFFVSDIITDAFSREWLANHIYPNDRVSTIGAGTIDRIYYLPRSSATFKLAFLASFFIFTLLRIGANTITIAEVEELPLNVGGLMLGTTELSRTILNDEQVLGVNYAYETQPNWIIPRPALKFIQQGNSIEYTSDIIRFNHSCQWVAPYFQVVQPPPGGSQVVIGEEEFYFGQFFEPPNRNMLNLTTSGPAVYFLPPNIGSTAPTFAFLFFGGNSTYPLNSDPLLGNGINPLSVVGIRTLGNTIDLSGLPTVYNASWFNFSGKRFKASNGHPLVFRAPLITALLCKVQTELTAGRVRLVTNNLTVVSSSDTRRVHNIDDRLITPFFSEFLTGVEGSNPDLYVWVSGGHDLPSQSQLLLDVPAILKSLLFPNNMTSSDLIYASMRPLALNDINANLDASALSVSKAQVVDEVEKLTKNDPGRFAVIRLSVTLLNPQPALASNLLWFAATAFTAFATLCLCLMIAFRLVRESNPPFELKHILRELDARRCSMCQTCQCQKS